MIIVHVFVHVKEKNIEAFKAATIENAENSLKELGIARFDLVQQMDDPTRFVIVEAFYDAAAVEAHKETAHYAKWKADVAEMMGEPRRSMKYSNIYPEKGGKS